MKTIYLSLSLYLLTTFLVDSISAQPYVIKRLGVEDGMSSNYVQDVVQDNKGYIWVATSFGLNRFDGQKFIVFGQNHHELNKNWVNALMPDPVDDKLWIGTEQGLYCFNYDTETSSPYPFPLDTKNYNIVTGMTASTNGGIWITHLLGGVAHYSAGKMVCYTPENVEGLVGNFKTAVDDGNGNLYIGHMDKGLSIVSIKDRRCKNYRSSPTDPNGLPCNKINVIYIDRNRNIWLGTDEGLVLFNPQKESFVTFRHEPGNPHSLLANQVVDIQQMADQTLWVCTYMGGVSILNLQENAFTAPENTHFVNILATADGHGLSGPNAQSVMQDSFGNIWIGNYRGGIDFISHTQPAFKTLPYFVERTGKMKQVWGVWADNDQRIWLGGEGELALYEEDKKLSVIRMDQGRLTGRTHINTIYRDTHENLWLGTHRNGVAVYSEKSGRIRCIGSEDTANLDILCFYEDVNEKLLIGTLTGVYSYDSDRLVYEEQINKQLVDRAVRGLLKDKNQNMWIAAKGVFIFNTEGKLIQSFAIEKGFPARIINSMKSDSRNRIWLATTEGVVVFNDVDNLQNYQFYGKNEGLENTNVRAVQEDVEGNIWLSTNGGISRFDEVKRVFYNYNKHDGVPMGDFMDGSSCISTDGMMCFGSQGGACCFNPQEVMFRRETVLPVITCFSVYDRQTETKDAENSIPLADYRISLLHDQNTFKVAFNVLDYALNSQVEFSYKLEGLDDMWYNTQGEKSVIFRNIPPGDYIFEIRGRLRNQEWSEETAMLAIHISPPFWFAWYAKLFYLLLVILFAYVILRFYKRKLDLEGSLEVERKKAQNEQELNNERLRFYTNITHELRTPLTLILGPLEDLLGDTTLSPSHANKISIIRDSSTRLLNLINRILEFRKTETQNRKLSVAKGNLAHLVQETGLRYKELNRNPNVKFHITIETEEVEMYFDADMLITVLDNLLSNAVKYTSEGDINLTLRSVEKNGLKYTEISVSDTGHGIAPDALPHIFERYYQAKSKYQVAGSGIGLALVKGLVELHEGILDVESVLNEGTTFTVRLLTENTYPNASHISVESNSMESREVVEMREEGRPIILVVEDNEDILEYVKNSFVDEYEVVTAKNGKEGWTLAEARIPNVIISDIMMPVMDGIEMCRLVKEDMRTSHIPVILLTAKDSLHDKEAGYEAGADSYLTKPFSAKLLHSRIDNLLETRRKIAASLVPGLAFKQEVQNSLNKLDNKFLQKITEIIEDNLIMEKMDVAFIADKMCMSHSTLYRKVKGVTNMSINEFIRKVKLRNAVKFMLSGEYTISAISYMTGFSSLAYFRQCFKSEFGMPPSEYLKQQIDILGL